jgi:predicted peroxiredoxin/TusA-related sulfurtransferase
MAENKKYKLSLMQKVLFLIKRVAVGLILLQVAWGCASTSSPSPIVAGSLMKNDQSIDIRGKTITTYILYQTRVELNRLDEGQVLEVVTDNYAAIESDIKAWSRMSGNPLIEVEKTTGFHRYYFKKKKPEAEVKHLSIIVSEENLEALLSPLGFALSAAISGHRVSIYFQGPAVRALKKGFSEKLQGFSYFFSGFARKELSDLGHISPQQKLGQLRELGAEFFICQPSMDAFGVKKADLIFEDVKISEYFTFLEIMQQADIHLYP